MARLKKKAPKKAPKKKARYREYEEPRERIKKPSDAWMRMVEPWWEAEEDLVEFELTATTKGGTPSDRRR